MRKENRKFVEFGVSKQSTLGFVGTEKLLTENILIKKVKYALNILKKISISKFLKTTEPVIIKIPIGKHALRKK